MSEKDNLSHIAYQQIKKKIMAGELKQGQAVSINAMADTLKISRTPVTNACQRLEYEKLLTVVPKQGVIINTISIADACGIYELRAAIESFNAKRIMDDITANDIEVLKESIQKQMVYMESKDIHAFMDEDTFFHRYLLNKNPNTEWESIVNLIFDRAYLLGIKNKTTSRLLESINEHKEVLKALELRDRQAFANSLEYNILNGFRTLTSNFFHSF